MMETPVIQMGYQEDREKRLGKVLISGTAERELSEKQLQPDRL